MSDGPLIWGAGLTGSALLHAGAGAVLLWSVLPDPVRDQPVPETRVQLAAYRVQRSAAVEARPRAEAAEPGEAAGARLGQGAIPRTQAAPLAPAPQDLAAVAEPATQTAKAQAAQAERAPAQTTPAEPAPAQALTAVNLPEVPGPMDQPPAVAPQVLPLATTQPATVAAARGELTALNLPGIAEPAEPVAATTPEPFSLAAAEQVPEALMEAGLTAANIGGTTPTPTAAATSRPDPVPAAPLAPASDRATGAEPVPVVLRQSEPQAEALRAELAFSGTDGPVDPVSLAAFQSFMDPEQAGGEALRDGIAGLLAQVPCSRMQVQFRPETNQLELFGHVPEDGMRAPVLAALQAQMGANIAVRDNLLILPRPQCGALSGIASVGLPQSTDQITNPLLVGEDTHARAFRYTEGQQLVLDLTGADYPAYVYVDYFDAAGQVIHLSPNDSVPLALTPPKSAMRVGADRPGDPGLYITIGPPYGQEIAVAFTASRPLYDGLRPLVEPAGPYLDWLRGRVAQARAADPGFKGEWVYFFVTTAAR